MLRLMLVAALSVAVSPCSAQQPPPPRPNLVLFLVDDLGWNDVGCMGHRFHETPHIDRLAATGLVLTAAYSNGPNCAPTRACLMSGQYAPRHGIYTVGNAARGRSRDRKLIPIANQTVLSDRCVTLAETLQAAGYATASVGKWHLGADPTTQGFDVNVGGDRRGSPHRGYFAPYHNPTLADGPDGEYLTDRLTDEAIAFIERHRARPFFLYMTHYSVHTPIQGRPDLVAKYRDKAREHGADDDPRYAAMVESTDASLGRIVAALDRLELTDDTVFVFFSDNGGHGAVTSMEPLRGAKGMLYEGGVRVPMIVRWPGRTPHGVRDNTPVMGIDLYPTLCAIAGVERPRAHPLDGVDLTPVLTGTGTIERRALFWHFPAYLQSTGRRSRSPAPWRTTPAGAIRDGRYKLLEFFEDDRLELYDLATDIGEQHDLAAAQPERVARLHGELVAWRASLRAPVPTERNPEYRAR